MITGTVDPLLDGPPSPQLLVQCLSAYIARFQAPAQLQVVGIPADHSHLDWAGLWTTVQQLLGTKQPVVLVYPGSLGDSMDPNLPHLTMADLARDWRLPVLLTLPAQEWAASQAAAFSALARQAQAQLQGFVLCQGRGVVASDLNLAQLRMQIQSLTQVAVLGCLPGDLSLSDHPRLAQVAAELDWEHLQWWTGTTHQLRQSEEGVF